jgi:arabinogalactan endo-1,4-beta-galactosidase
LTILQFEINFNSDKGVDLSFIADINNNYIKYFDNAGIFKNYDIILNNEGLSIIKKISNDIMKLSNYNVYALLRKYNIDNFKEKYQIEFNEKSI